MQLCRNQAPTATLERLFLFNPRASLDGKAFCAHFQDKIFINCLENVAHSVCRIAKQVNKQFRPNYKSQNTKDECDIFFD